MTHTTPAGAGTVTSKGISRRTDTGSEWEAEREGTVVNNDDGTRTRTVEGTKTLDDGTVITGSSESTITRTEDGRTWETEGTREGPQGTTTITGSGEGQRTEDGFEPVGRIGNPSIHRAQSPWWTDCQSVLRGP